MSTGLPLFDHVPRPGPRARFDGAAYSPGDDDRRLSKQHEAIRALMLDGRWRTLAEISSVTGQPAASVSAQLRHLRKARFGGYVVQREPRGERGRGLYAYRVLPPGSDPGPRKPTQRERMAEAIRFALTARIPDDVARVLRAALEGA